MGQRQHLSYDELVAGNRNAFPTMELIQHEAQTVPHRMSVRNDRRQPGDAAGKPQVSSVDRRRLYIKPRLYSRRAAIE